MTAYDDLTISLKKDMKVTILGCHFWNNLLTKR